MFEDRQKEFGADVKNEESWGASEADAEWRRCAPTTPEGMGGVIDISETPTCGGGGNVILLVRQDESYTENRL